jgi:hypothetical protein
MPTRTAPRHTARASRTARPTTGRFARPTPARRPSLRRKPPQKSGLDKALGGLTGLLPSTAAVSRAAKKAPAAGGKGKKAGLAAVVAGAAGLALKKRNDKKHEAAVEPVASAPGPVTPDPLAPSPMGPAAPAPVAPTAHPVD